MIVKISLLMSFTGVSGHAAGTFLYMIHSFLHLTLEVSQHSPCHLGAVHLIYSLLKQTLNIPGVAIRVVQNAHLLHLTLEKGTIKNPAYGRH